MDENAFAKWKTGRDARIGPDAVRRENEAIMRAIANASVEDRVMTVVEDPSTLLCIPWALGELDRLRAELDAAVLHGASHAACDGEVIEAQRAELTRLRAIEAAAIAMLARRDRTGPGDLSMSALDTIAHLRSALASAQEGKAER